MVNKGNTCNKEPGQILRHISNDQEGGSPVLFFRPQINHIWKGSNAGPPYGRIAEGADSFTQAAFGSFGYDTGIVPYGPFDNGPLIPGGRKIMGGFQSAVISKHGLLVVEQSADQPSVRIIPEGQVGEQVDQPGNCHKKYQTEYNGAFGARAELLQNMSVGNAVGMSGWISGSIDVFPISSIQYGEENQSQSTAGIHAGPFAGYAQPHTDPAGTQRQECLLQRAVIETYTAVLVHKIIH